MTVKALIKKLESLDQNALIKLYMRSEYGSGWQRYDLYTVVQEDDDSGEKVYVIYHD